METDNKNIYVSSSQEKWDKGKLILDSWWKVYTDNTKEIQPMFEHKDMERKRGFLAHLSTVYP